MDTHGFSFHSDPAAEQWEDGRFATLYDYWDQRRNGRAMPSRADIDPLDIPLMMDHTFILDVVEGERVPLFRYRLAGTSVVRAFGRELTGYWMHDLFPGFAPSLANCRDYFSVVRQQAPVSYRGLASLTSMLLNETERLLLPLGETDDRVDMIFGMSRFHSARPLISGPSII